MIYSTGDQLNFGEIAFIIVQSEENNSLKIWYWAGEVDDKILIRITANNKEATRLFTKAANNTIIPASPLTIRLNQ